ncbi:MAG: hypothetical protein IKZ53_03480 [Selenomonadaceae bacterium]|nr:hypothetical protein [Selenomonadaceae bacterium]
MIKIKVDTAQAVAGLNKINAAQIRSRLQAAIRSSLEQSKSIATQRVSARFTRDFATPLIKIKSSGLNGSLSVTDRRHSLSRFPHQPSSRINPQPPGGVTAQVRRGQSENYPRAFIGRGQIFERVGRPRVPLKRHLGAGGANELGSSRVAPFVERKIGERIERELGDLL